MKKSAEKRNLVYSTEGGRHCPQCARPVAQCSCKRGGKREASDTGAPADGIVRIQRESKGRGGKAVTVVRGLPLDDQALRALAKTLKQRCGVGGAVKDGCVELQGDQRSALQQFLTEQGYTVKLAGG